MGLIARPTGLPPALAYSGSMFSRLRSERPILCAALVGVVEVGAVDRDAAEFEVGAFVAEALKIFVFAVKVDPNEFASDSFSHRRLVQRPVDVAGVDGDASGKFRWLSS